MQPKDRLEEEGEVLYISNIMRPGVLRLCWSTGTVSISSLAFSREKMGFNVLHTSYIIDI